MSTKQAVVFSFMLVFLITTVVTVALWFHFALESDVKDRALKLLDEQKGELTIQRDKLHTQVVDPVAGLDAKVRSLKETTEAHIDKYLRETSDSRWKLYVAQGKEIEQKWGPQGEAAKAWGSVNDAWQKENKEILDARTKLLDADKTSADQLNTSRTELKGQLEEEERRKRENILKRKGWTKDLALIRNHAEETQERVNEVTRELERLEGDEKDAEVIFATQHTVTVDLGYVHGAKEGLKFTVFVNKGTVAVRKGTIRLTDIRATSSDAIILPDAVVQMYDPSTGWLAPDPKMRYSPYSTAGTDGTEPQRLERLKSKREQIREQRAEMQRQEREADGADAQSAVATNEAGSEPPIVLGKGLEPITAGDWISNTEFHRVMPDQQFEKVLINHLIAMQDVSLNPQTFCFSPLVKPYRQEYLKRLCERNACKTAPQMSAEVDYLVTSPDTTSLELVKQRLGDMKPEAMADEANLPPDRLALVRTYKALAEGRKHGAKAMSESQLEEYFLDRGRKQEMLAGQAKQPGQFVFFVVGETKARSVRETNLYIKEHGGVIAANLDEKVDYLVVGEGMNEAKWDKASRRIYYAGQVAPATAVPFSDAVKTSGLRVLREDELPKFFGR